MRATILLTKVLLAVALAAFGGYLAELAGIPVPLRLQAAAQGAFHHDFSDGNAMDGIPVTWDPSWSGATVEVIDRSMILSNNGLASAWVRENYTDVSIRARMRLIEEDGVGLQARLTFGQPIDNFYSWLNPDGQLSLWANRPTAPAIELGSIDTSLGPMNQDAIMRLTIHRAFRLRPTSIVVGLFRIFAHGESAAGWLQGVTDPGLTQITVRAHWRLRFFSSWLRCVAERRADRAFRSERRVLFANFIRTINTR